MAGRIIDISVPLVHRIPTWPGDPEFALNSFMHFDRGDPAIASEIKTCLHTGTHVDAPLHFVPGGKSVDQLDLGALIGECWVCELDSSVDQIDPEHLHQLDIPGDVKRILFKTSNSQLWQNPTHPFKRDFVAFTPESAQVLVDRGVKLVGIDYLSVQGFFDRTPLTHQIFLKADTVIIEGLDLREASPGRYELICLPVKIAGAEGALARAVLREV